MKIVEWFKYVVTHRFVRDTVMLQVGTIGATLIQAASGVIIARLLRPELFGQYSIAFSVASIATIFLGAGVQDAVAPQTARAWASGDKGSLDQALGFWAKFTFANIIATLALVFLLPTIAAHLYHNNSLGGYAAVIVIASLISTTVFTLAQLMLQIAGHIRALSALTFADVVMRYGASIALVLGGFGIWGAMSGHLIGAAVLLGVSLVVYEWLVRRYPKIPGLRSLWSLARTTTWQPLLRPTLWVMADRNLSMLYGALPVAMVGLYASSTEVAYFKLAFGYMILGMSALGPISTLLNVHFPTVQIRDTSRLQKTLIRITLYATGLSAIITFAILAISPIVFRVLYGVAYLPSIPYVMGFGLFGALFGLGVGLGPMWRAVNKVHISIIINMVTLGLGIPLGIWLITVWHVWGAVIMVTLWYTFSHMASFLYLLKTLKVRAK